MELFKYSDFNLRTQRVLLSKNVWYSSRQTLNDPYDCFPIIDLDLSRKELNEYFQRLKGFQFDDRIPIELIQQKILSTFTEAYLDDVGVYCLSKEPVNELMWAHYANNHYGIMIGWEVGDGTANSASENHMNARPVRYSGRGSLKMSEIHKCFEILTHVDSATEKSKRKEGEKLLAKIIGESNLRKNTAWEYENEIRYIRQDGFGETPFDASISSITYGCRFDMNLKPQVDFALDHGVDEYRMELGVTGLTRVRL